VTQQSLKALVVLLASIPLLAVLTPRSAVEPPRSHAVSQYADSSLPIPWLSSVRLDTFGPPEGIVIPQVPPPIDYGEGARWFPNYFDSDIPADVFILPVRQPQRAAMPSEEGNGVVRQFSHYHIGDDGDYPVPLPSLQGAVKARAR
jgi:hypothetical protein